MSTPSSRRPSATRSAASASMRVSSRSSAWTSVTFEPTRAKNCASSHPTGPPPSTTSASGTSVVSVASTFVQYSSSPGMGGIAGSEPVAITSRSYSSSCSPTLTTPGRVDDRVAAHELAALPGEPFDLRGVIPLGDEIAPREHACRVERPRLEPRRPARLRDELGRPQHRLRRHAGPVRALAADEPALDERQLGRGVEPAEGSDEMLAGRPSTENDDTQGARGARWPSGTTSPRSRPTACRPRRPCSWRGSRAG